MPGVLEVRGLAVDLVPERAGPRTLFSEVSFQVPPASIVGLCGESGCGKTTLALALMGLLPPHRYRVGGSVQLQGREVGGFSDGAWRPLRGAGISLVFQDPALALNPVMRVRDQVREVARAHRLSANPEDALRMVGLDDPARIAASYPHQLSGGERQRVAIAQALLCRPPVVIADEPFTALDATSTLALATLFENLKAATGTSFLVISHSHGVLARIAGTVLAIQNGRLAEIPSTGRADAH